MNLLRLVGMAGSSLPALEPELEPWGTGQSPPTSWLVSNTVGKKVPGGKL